MSPTTMHRPPLRLSALLDSDVFIATPSDHRRLLLTSEQRAKTRFRTTLSDGAGAIVMLARGSVITPGARLVADSGEVVTVVAASEPIYRVVAKTGSADPAFDLLRATYHLGNRHVPVELGRGFVKLERDPVLRDLLLRLDMIVTSAFEPFDPEPGAYGGGHRHDSDVDGGAIGEALSQSAHAMPSRDSGPPA